eukprot:jgi/Ulvmu1/12059/UM083_0072.1
MTEATPRDSASVRQKYPIYDNSDVLKVNNIWTAAQFGDKKFLITLLEKSHDVDVNCLDNIGRSPLHWAVENAHRGVTRTLLDYGADPLIPESGTMRTPVFLAIKQNDIQLLQILVENLSKEQVMDVINRADRAGITPLSLCRERQAEHLEALAWIMQHGAKYEQG